MPRPREDQRPGGNAEGGPARASQHHGSAGARPQDREAPVRQAGRGQRGEAGGPSAVGRHPKGPGHQGEDPGQHPEGDRHLEGRPESDAGRQGSRRGRFPCSRPEGPRGGNPDRGGRLDPPTERDRRRHRHPRHLRRPRARDQDVRGAPRGARRARPRRDQGLHPPPGGDPGGSQGRRAGGIRRGAPVLHRLQGAQRPHPRDRLEEGTQAERVRGLQRRRTGGSPGPPRKRCTGPWASPGSLPS